MVPDDEPEENNSDSGVRAEDVENVKKSVKRDLFWVSLLLIIFGIGFVQRK